MVNALALTALFVGAAATSAAPASAAKPSMDAVRAPAAQLVEVEASTSWQVRFRRFRQVIGGVPVLGSNAVLTDAPGRRADLVVDRTRKLAAVSTSPRVSRAEAVRLAIRRLGVAALRARPRASLVIVPRPAARLAWRVLLAAERPFASVEVLVDARSGRLFRSRDLLVRETGSAMIFDPNPVVANGGFAGLADAGDADSPLLTNLRAPRPLLRLDSSTCLRGRWAEAVLPGGDVCSPTRNFTAVTRADDRFEAVMAYFHIDRVQGYLQSLGFVNVANRRVRATVNAPVPGPPTESGQDNSFFDPLSGELTFGTGFSDDAEDAETIVHEYAHAIQDDQVPGFPLGGDDAAMGEGFGDYLASSIAARFTPRAAFDGCFNEWDAFTAGDGPCLRRVDWNLRPGEVSPDCPVAADEHCRGEVWSGALWAIRSAVGAAATDRLVIQSHFSLSPGATFDEASRALLAADRVLYAGAHQALLKSVLGSRGLVDVERLDDGPLDAVPLAIPARRTGYLSAASDPHDVFAVRLARRAPVVIRLTAASGDFDLRLLPPGSATVDDAPAAAAETATSTEVIRYSAPATATYFVDVRAISGAGPYRLEIASDDRDGDGVADGRDVCPNRSDPRQRDWDRDRRGDVCDPSARVRITGLAKVGGKLRVRLRAFPVGLPARAMRLQVSKRRCAGKRCSYRRIRSLRARRVRRGRTTLRFKVKPARYRLQAALRHPRYRKVRSPRRQVTVRR